MAEQKSKEAVSKSGMGAISGTVASLGTSRSWRSRSESYLLIWVDSSFDEKREDCQNTLKQLRSVVNEVRTLTTPAQCITFLNEMDKQRAFVVSSGDLGQDLVPEIHGTPRVDTIYIFCANKQRHEGWAKHWSKIQGVYTEILPICDLLKKATREVDHDAISMSIVPKQVVASDGEKQNLDQLEPSFMYTVLFKEIILEIEEDDSKAMEQLVNHCRKTGGTDEYELRDFERRYHQKSPIWWYTCEIFLYGMVNRALRCLEMETMVKLGFFIRKLHQQLEQLYREQVNSFKEKFVVYRGQGFNEKDFHYLNSNKGGLLSFNSFLSTSKLKQVSMNSIKRKLAKHPEKVGVLFIMTIDPEKVSISSSTPFALIDHVSAIPTEQEILFSMHTIFRIETIQLMKDKKRIYEVQLTLIDDNDPQLTGLTQRMREQLKGSRWHRMGQLMLRVGGFNGAEQVYMELLKSTNNKRTRSLYFGALARAKRNQGEYEEAVKYYEKSIEIKERTLDKNDRNLATSYNNIALVYNNMGEYSKALEYYEKSIEIKKIALPQNHPRLATSYHNIATVYYDLEKYSKALELFERALEIQREKLPPAHPDIADTKKWIEDVKQKL